MYDWIVMISADKNLELKADDVLVHKESVEFVDYTYGAYDSRISHTKACFSLQNIIGYKKKYL